MNFIYCELPDQIGIYLGYGALATATLLITILFARSPTTFLPSMEVVDEEIGLKVQPEVAGKLAAVRPRKTLVGAAVLQAKTVACLCISTFVSAFAWHLLLMWIYL